MLPRLETEEYSSSETQPAAGPIRRLLTRGEFYLIKKTIHLAAMSFLSGLP